jgi:hypothetical protein
VAYFSWYAGGFRVFDISDPASPAELGHYIDDAGNNFWGVALAEDQNEIGSCWRATGTTACSSSDTRARCPRKGGRKERRLEAGERGRLHHPRSGVSARGHLGHWQATFKLREGGGTALLFKINVANIDNVFASHVHCGAVGVNGPVGVTLFTAPPREVW